MMKRKHIDLTRTDRFGHWWFEIGTATDPKSESYGWWPADPVNLKQSFSGVNGELNGQSMFGGEPTRDPHHGESADEEFHPLVAADDPRSDDEIADCLRKFAQAFTGDWRWLFGVGPNCHTFQKDAMVHCHVMKL